MRNIDTKRTAICGVTAALAVVIMSFGTLIPFVTYVCPVLCMLLGNAVFHICKAKFAWTWYAAVAILSCMLSPDKEAAFVYVLLGFYPYVKQFIDKMPLKVIIKLLYFNASAYILYIVMIYILGVDGFLDDFQKAGIIGVCVILLLGNITFILLDMLLSKVWIKIKP